MFCSFLLAAAFLPLPAMYTGFCVCFGEQRSLTDTPAGFRDLTIDVQTNLPRMPSCSFSTVTSIHSCSPFLKLIQDQANKMPRPPFPNHVFQPYWGLPRRLLLAEHVWSTCSGRRVNQVSKLPPLVKQHLCSELLLRLLRLNPPNLWGKLQFCCSFLWSHVLSSVTTHSSWPQVRTGKLTLLLSSLAFSVPHEKKKVKEMEWWNILEFQF